MEAAKDIFIKKKKYTVEVLTYPQQTVRLQNVLLKVLNGPVADHGGEDLPVVQADVQTAAAAADKGAVPATTANAVPRDGYAAVRRFTFAPSQIAPKKKFATWK